MDIFKVVRYNEDNDEVSTSLFSLYSHALKYANDMIDKSLATEYKTNKNYAKVVKHDIKEPDVVHYVIVIESSTNFIQDSYVITNVELVE